MNSTLIGNNWDNVLNDEFDKMYYAQLASFLLTEYELYTIYPKEQLIFEALKLTPPEQVKVVILGQDPYINPKEAHGLAFSVQEGTTPPPSLKNIYKELESDLGIINTTGDLTSWAKEGVLLLNTTLTVRAGESNSHYGKGWGLFTDAIIKYLGNKCENIVFILWGKKAQEKEYLINKDKHLILRAPHPSPLSAYRGFFGSKPFSKTNNFLKSINKKEINWKL